MPTAVSAAAPVSTGTTDAKSAADLLAAAKGL